MKNTGETKKIAQIQTNESIVAICEYKGMIIAATASGAIYKIIPEEEKAENLENRENPK